MKFTCTKLALLLAAVIPFSLGAQASQAGGADHADHTDHTGHNHPVAGATTAPEWDKAVVELFGSLPVQEGGRVKPLSTMAGFKLLKLNGKRKVKTPEGRILEPTAWMMDCLFFPEVAENYECFRIQNDEVLTAIGLSVEGKRKRDYYSFAQLRPNIEQLMTKAREWAHIKPQEMNTVQRQLVALASNIVDYTDLAHEFDFTSVQYFAGDGPELLKILGAPSVSLGTVLSKFPEIRQLAMRVSREAGENDPDRIATLELFQRLEAVQGAAKLALIAPEVPIEDETQWNSATDLISVVFSGEQPAKDGTRLVDLMADLREQRSDPAAFSKALTELHAGAASLADARGEYRKIPIEQNFYKADFFYRALSLFLIGFLLATIGWLKPNSIWIQRGVWASVLGGTILATVGITMRCIIRSRPPVSTLYETILFTGVVCVLVALVIEYINRQRIALVMASVFGALGMWISMKYELKEAATAGDTMPSLVAVLDTNFWLSTHVTTVTMGYSAGLLAALLAHVWIFGKAFGLKRHDAAFYKHVTRMVYGVLCFGLLFSVVGTILGGIWANYSWGRFWGWDAKENGALLICLWELMILHLRMGGYIRDRGLCVLAIIGGCVVAFSWWGVNLLGVGLHSYGFTSGIAIALYGFMAVEAVILLVTWAIAIGQGRGSDPSTGGLSSDGLAQ